MFSNYMSMLSILLCVVVSGQTLNCKLMGLVATPTLSGVGHDVMGLLTAIRVGDILSTELYLHDGFWLADSERHKVHSGNYSFMEQWFRFPYLKDVKYNKSITRVEQVRSLSKFLSSAHDYCGAMVLINFGAKHACNNGFCCNIPGMYDRSATLVSYLIPNRLNREGTRSRHHLLAIESDSELELVVCWHIRSGDIIIGIDTEAILRLKSIIDSQLSTKLPRHFFVTQNATQVKHFFRSHLHVLAAFTFVETSEMRDTVDVLMDADILVSMGSSGSYIIPALKSHTRLVHFYFPPKETFMDTMTWQQTTRPLTNQDISASLAYRGYFIRKGVVPVNHNTGEVFPEYFSKMRTMLNLIDAGQAIPLEVSMIHFETWRPWVLNVSSGVWYDDGLTGSW